MTTTNVSHLKFNKLSENQYEATTPVDGEFYITPEADYALNANVIHKTGHESITGQKLFLNTDDGCPCGFKNTNDEYNVTPSAQIVNTIGHYDKNGQWLGGWESYHNTDGVYVKQIATRQQGGDNYGILGVATNPSGYSWGFAPNVNIGSASNEIITAVTLRNMLNNFFAYWGNIREFRTLYNGSIGSGTINLSAAYDDCAFIIAEGGNDSNGNRTFFCQNAWNITTSRSWGIPWLLWTNGAGNYWLCSPSSSTTSFITQTENSVINHIYGVKF